MNDNPRKKSPRAPSASLDESVDRAIKIYEKERRHAAPTDVIAQNLGYKSANNGAALSAIASLRSYGLLERVQDGTLAVSKDVETYLFAPSDELKNQLRIKWLKAPGIFSELLEKYEGGLPSDASMRFDLIQRGFAPASAESTLDVFKRSVEFAKFFQEQPGAIQEPQGLTSGAEEYENQSDPIENGQNRPSEVASPISGVSTLGLYDRIPVRLTGGRRAWLEIPTEFYEGDKKRLIAQIDLILTEDEAT